MRNKKLSLKEAIQCLNNLDDSDLENINLDESEDEWLPSNSPDLSHLISNEEESTSDSEEEEDVFPTKAVKEKKKPIRWSKNSFQSPDVTFSHTPNTQQNALQSPYTYFSKYYCEDTFNDIAEKTNMFSVSTSGNCVETCVEEIKKLIALHLIIGILPFPRLRLFWKPSTTIKLVEKIGMTRNRFEKLRNYLHIVDVNASHDANDKIWKVRPLIKKFEERCNELSLEEYLCVDESMIPFTGQLSIKQYVKGKPNPWGVKIFMLCGESGIVYNSIVYQGSLTPVDSDLKEKFGSTGAIVLYLTNRIPSGFGYKLFFDNYFTSIPLLNDLLEKRIFAAGTVRRNRLSNCPLKSDAQLKKDGRGSCDNCVTEDGKIAVVKWFDNRAVTLASTFLSDNAQDTVKRWSKKDATFIDVARPEIVKFYNKSMGGVDKHDFLISLYRIAIKSRKWTLRIIFHYFNMAVINSWLEYKRDATSLGINVKNQMDLLDFTFEVAETLSFLNNSAASTKRGRPSGSSPILPLPKKKCKSAVRPCKDVRYDGLNHMIERSQKQQRCKLEGCSYKTTSFCEKCDVFLCFHAQRNCFKMFHTK